MKTLKNSIVYGVVLACAAGVSSVYAEDADLTQTRSQERVRSELSLQTPEGEPVQSRQRKETKQQKAEKKMNEYKYQHQNKYGNKDNAQFQQQSSATRQNMMNRSMGGKR